MALDCIRVACDTVEAMSLNKVHLQFRAGCQDWRDFGKGHGDEHKCLLKGPEYIANMHFKILSGHGKFP